MDILSLLKYMVRLTNFSSERIATTLSEKELTNATLTGATFNDVFTVTDNNESYYGLSEDVVVGENTLKFVNGILVAIG